MVGAEQQAEIVSKQHAISDLVELDDAAQKMAFALYLDQIEVNDRGLWAEAAALFEENTKDQPGAHAV